MGELDSAMRGTLIKCIFFSGRGVLSWWFCMHMHAHRTQGNCVKVVISSEAPRPVSVYYYTCSGSDVATKSLHLVLHSLHRT